MTKVYRCFRITINATIIKTTSSADVTIVSDTYILDRTCIEYHHMIADSTYRRGMLIGVEVCYRLHPANQFRTVAVKRQDISLMRRKFIIDKYFTPTGFIQYGYFYPITEFTQSVHQDDVYILNECVMPNLIISNVVLDVLNATVIPHRDIVECYMTQTGMFFNSTRQCEL